MKKIILVLCFLFLFLLTSCSNQNIVSITLSDDGIFVNGKKASTDEKDTVYSKRLI